MQILITRSNIRVNFSIRHSISAFSFIIQKKAQDKGKRTVKEQSRPYLFDRELNGHSMSGTFVAALNSRN
jgi:hypothetical protein